MREPWPFRFLESCEEVAGILGVVCGTLILIFCLLVFVIAFFMAWPITVPTAIITVLIVGYKAVKRMGVKDARH